MTQSLKTLYGIYETKKISKKEFSICIEYIDTTNRKRHITLAYVSNFPTYKKYPVKSQLKHFFDIWNNIVHYFFEETYLQNYIILKSNKLIMGKNSIWFKSLNDNSLNNLILIYKNILHKEQKKEIINKNIIIDYPHSNKLFDCYAHSMVDAANENNPKSLIPKEINLSNLNIC